jgi:hypothetical protein
MSRKHAAKSLAIHPDPVLRAHLRSIAGPHGSVAAAARRLIEARIAAGCVSLPRPEPGPGKPVRVQLSRSALTTLRRMTVELGQREEVLALAILTLDLTPP